MRHRKAIWGLGLMLASLAVGIALPHEQEVHREMALKGSEAAAGRQAFLEEFFGSSAVTFTAQFDDVNGGAAVTKSASEWIGEGADREDFGLRSKNHFYEPITERGLTATSATGFFGVTIPIPDGMPSLDWATVPPAQNQYGWPAAREALYKGLTQPQKSDRNQELATAFRALGQVAHLIQDLSQPEHVRDDAHPPFNNNNRIEAYAIAPFPGNAKRWQQNPQWFPVASLDWRGEGIAGLRDFWDRDLYVVGAGQTPPVNPPIRTMGLAEHTALNYLGQDALYKEVVLAKQGESQHVHPLPRLATSTNYLQSPLPEVGGFYLIDKIRDGIPVSPHSVIPKLAYPTGFEQIQIFGAVQGGVDLVLQKYHDDLLPLGTRFTGGVVDYFFRGQLAVDATWQEGTGNYELRITNRSGGPLQGGAFECHYDDANDVRTPLPVAAFTVLWTPASRLNDGETVTALLAPPAVAGIKQFVLVYKGAIGASADAAMDPFDEGIAVAAKRFTLLRFHITWNRNADIDLHLIDPQGNKVFWANRVAPDPPNGSGAELDNDNIGGTGPENITVDHVIDGDYKVKVNYYSDAGSEEAQPPVIVTLETYFNSSQRLSQEAFTLTKMSFGQDEPAPEPSPTVYPSWYVRKTVKVLNGQVTDF